MLLAKSGAAGKRLAEHCLETMDTFEHLFGTAGQCSRLGNAWLHFFHLPSTDWERFHANGVAACGLHDLGKANDTFQDVVTSRGTEQAIRHEHLSALLLMLADCVAWLSSDSRLDRDLITAAVAGHHLKASPKRDDEYPACGEQWTMRSSFSVSADDADFVSLFEQVSARLNLRLFRPVVPRNWSFRQNAGCDAFALAEQLRNRFEEVKDALRSDDIRLRLFAAVKAAVIVADSAASGLVREGHQIQDWIGEAFSPHLVLDASSARDVINRRIEEIEMKKRIRDPGYSFSWGEYQDGAASLGERALLVAPCGSGKTLAAWRWIESQLARRSAARVIFLYPTRATATEGFRDYVSWAPEADAALVHGTARYELEGMFSNPEDIRHGCHFEPEDRLFSLAFWKRRIFSATVDQFLGFMQQAYRSICLLPVLVDSVVVIDEVHSFDRKLFSSLKRFLESFDIPVLSMTASLPQNRRTELLQKGLQLFPEREQFADLDSIANLQRYRVAKVNGRPDAESIARQAFNTGKRVLWVVNTVDRCQAIAEALGAICYHSRFRLEDRDLDADVLISEIAPVTAMIQRMGRCNRHARRATDGMGDVYFYEPERIEPYERADIEGVKSFVENIVGGEVSQSRLEELLEAYGPREREIYRLARFLDDGPWSEGGREDLRDIDQFTVPAILDGDVDRFLNCRRRKQPTDGLIVPVKRKHARPDERIGAWPLVASGDLYDATFGYRDRAMEVVT